MFFWVTGFQVFGATNRAIARCNVAARRSFAGAVCMVVPPVEVQMLQLNDGCTRCIILLMAEILHQLRLVVYPIIYKVLYIPGGCLGFLPTVALKSLQVR